VELSVVVFSLFLEVVDLVDVVDDDLFELLDNTEEIVDAILFVSNVLSPSDISTDLVSLSDGSEMVHLLFT